ncbi:SDR family oxidoreductase [Neobacillus pocheonensis]|uniref:SDR family oxidoreductase n=1 Tax=Neobacillus pocheonensis TaxID=363869 RepID=A0ABT0W843_9BACI|nr:SDR family oxidoreductase [Neobacillus pocheonensis]
MTGKTAGVIGGSNGFGRGIVTALHAQGMRIIAIAKNKEHLDTLKNDLKGTICGNVTDPVLAARVIEEEKPHVLVLNAGARGINRPTRLHTWETFSTQYEVDLKSAFYWVREALNSPLDNGSTIILGSSGAALRPMFVNAAYAAAKAAIWAFALGVAGEAEQFGIRVHCLLPIMAAESEVGSQALRDFSKYTGVPVEKIIEQKDMKPFVTPEIVGNAVVKILTDPTKSSTVGFRITGTEVIPVR